MEAVIAIVSSRVEAELIVGMLQSHGVKAALSADDLGGLDMALQMQGVRVLVSEQDEMQARHLLNEREPLDLSSKPPNGFQKWLLGVLGARK